jgi:hypothetical protein
MKNPWRHYNPRGGLEEAIDEFFEFLIAFKHLGGCLLRLGLVLISPILFPIIANPIIEKRMAEKAKREREEQIDRIFPSRKGQSK